MRTELLNRLLRDTSRAFYLSLRVLPEGVREPIGLAYLLARVADTIADTRLLPPPERLRHLLAFRAQVQGQGNLGQVREIQAAITEGASTPGERRLMRHIDEAVALLNHGTDDQSVRDIVTTLTQGMEMDLCTFPSEDCGRLGVLESPADLDRYIYLVAGCVGEFWTRVTAAHEPALRHWDLARMSEIGIRFGKALQMTNVLRDLPRDLRNGRCYLPLSDLRTLGVMPEELLRPEALLQIRPLLMQYVRLTLDHYQAAERYLLSVPWHCLRLRLAVLWPILIGLATLRELVRSEHWLDVLHRIKISRAEVYAMVLLSIPIAWCDPLLTLWIGRLRKSVLG